MKKTALLIGYNVVAVIFLFLLSELAVRLFIPRITTQGTTRAIIADSLYGSTYGLKPQSAGKSHGAPVEVDRYGFRKCGGKIETSRASWLFLGDSVTFGPGVEGDSTFTGIVQAGIDSLNVLNPSTSGYHVKNYRDVFTALAIEDRHHLGIERVTIFWCLNDVYTNVPFDEIPGGKIRYLFSDFLSFAKTHSRLYHFLKNLLFDRPKSYYLFDKQFYDRENPEFQRAIDTILEISDSCRQRGIWFDLILLPYEYQLRTGDFAPQDLMEEVLTNAGIRIKRPFQTDAEKYPDFKAFFLYGDGIHFSNYGHRRLAEFMIAQLGTQ